ncbi:class II aldolase/adducin family protein [Teichococcus aestuarii]|uniref:class II aldolase/adducin family protein n=1 Tax=Teichococcus aestuarii TaxID=568898 RepID=UPI00361B3121
MTASSLLVCDFHGNVVAGQGTPEATAFYIHARLHMKHPRARAAFHTHMPNATALSMLEGPPLVWAGQTALKFYGRTAIDEDYNGLALDEAEGDRIAAAMGEADIVFMKNHGVMVVGPTIAEAWDDLYYLERACEVQRLGPLHRPHAEAGGARAGAAHLRADARGRPRERPAAPGEHQAHPGAGGTGLSRLSPRARPPGSAARASCAGRHRPRLGADRRS